MAATRSKFVTAFGTGTEGPTFNMFREQVYTYAGMVFLMLMCSLTVFDCTRDLVEIIRERRVGAVIEQTAFLLIISYLLWGMFHYHVGRLGYLKRLRTHRPASRAELEGGYDHPDVPPLTILIPSYCEEECVVRQTLLSAALLEYPDRTVVLLIDDPPNPSDPDAATALELMRQLPLEIEGTLQQQARKYADELTKFEGRRASGELDFASERHQLQTLYREAAEWLENLAASVEIRDHTDELFVERILRESARAHAARAAAIGMPRSPTATSHAALSREYKRLASLFAVRVTSFERKRFVNLSHASNKAMNLNSYIGLIGRSFRETAKEDGLYLEETDLASAHIHCARADYLITLDADSLLLNDYALRLTHVMNQPEGQQFGVVQTPYVAVPGSPNEIERVAGAQSDLQWITSQGSTHYRASFWIGANALLRYRALEEICRIRYERGHPIREYIRDRTLTEDTDSTVDLIAAGWRLYNYPDRLSYSATPPDFGALVIQRRRWANGGLVILPKLFRYLKTNSTLSEAVLRTQYLISTSLGNLAVLALMVYPFGGLYSPRTSLFAPESKWLLASNLSYLILYRRDLLLSNYKFTDFARILALNLLLIPVNLGGVAKSLHQCWTGQPPIFGRTPKVPGRTAAPPVYILTNMAIVTFLLGVAGFRVYNSLGDAAVFPLLSAVALGYALFRLVGIRHAWEDVVAGVALRAKRIGAAIRIRPVPVF